MISALHMCTSGITLATHSGSLHHLEGQSALLMLHSAVPRPGGWLHVIMLLLLFQLDAGSRRSIDA